MKLFKIGQLAKEADITVRTLHHYDEIGLFSPSGTRESGHRLYNAHDVERLQQIISLKSIGISLKEVAQCLDATGSDLLKTLKWQEAVVLVKIQEQQNVQKSLQLMIQKLEADQNLSPSELLKFMREVQNMEKYYTPEQLEKLQTRLQKFSKEAKQVEEAWPKLFKKFEEAMNTGLSPKDIEVQVLAAEAQHYIDLFTGGDPEIEKNHDKAVTENRENALNRWNVSAEIFDYASAARAHLKAMKSQKS